MEYDYGEGIDEDDSHDYLELQDIIVGKCKVKNTYSLLLL